MTPFSIAIHGGAGTILRSQMTPEKEAKYLAALKAALDTGYAVLEKGGSSLDAVEAAIISLEDCPLFNAGKGSVFNSEGRHEMDASIMYGKDLTAGAVTGVKNIKNPISLSRAVMERSQHVFLAGNGAEIFAREQGIAFEDDSYFFDQFRHDQWQQAQKEEGVFLDHNIAASDEKKFGTVGAVALDKDGHLAAGTSTGGMTNKKFGRVGDSPIIGAGTYANDNTCAISCTGHGELFIRSVVAYDISCLMEYKGMTLREACDEVVMNKLVKIGGEGGLIAIDRIGNVELPFNSEGMYRAYRKSDGNGGVLIYK
ncbi:MAG: isoaspartyl peptidase [Bacteroidetes bacterium]|nr:isoaspartyl peptidase [Bacteroidota bacterium]